MRKLFLLSLLVSCSHNVTTEGPESFPELFAYTNPALSLDIIASGEPGRSFDCFQVGGRAGPKPITREDLSLLASLWVPDKVAAYRADAPARCPDTSRTDCDYKRTDIWIDYAPYTFSRPGLPSFGAVFLFDPGEHHSATTEATFSALNDFAQSKCQ